MFSVIYSFEVIPGREEDFIKGWSGLTKLIYEFEGSLGSKLHKNKDGVYIAYANWPSESIWKGSGEKLPEEASIFRELMTSSCVKIETLFELNEVESFLQKDLFKN